MPPLTAFHFKALGSFDQKEWVLGGFGRRVLHMCSLSAKISDHDVPLTVQTIDTLAGYQASAYRVIHALVTIAVAIVLVLSLQTEGSSPGPRGSPRPRHTSRASKHQGLCRFRTSHRTRPSPQSLVCWVGRLRSKIR